MAWIQTHQALPTHRKTRRLARALDIGIPAAVGHLCIFWLWCLDNAAEGDLTALLPEDIGDGALWAGDAVAFVDAMVHAGFIERDGERLHLHDWQEFGGRLIQERKANAERMQNRRAAEKPFTERAGNVSQTYNERAVLEKSREEESRLDEKEEIGEDNTEHTHSHARERVRDGALAGAQAIGKSEYSFRFLSFWVVYPKKKNKAAAYAEWQRLQPDAALTRQIVTAVETQQADVWQFLDDPEKFTPEPKNWLRDRRWEDETNSDDHEFEDVPF